MSLQYFWMKHYMGYLLHSDENEKCGMDSWMLLTWIRTLGSSVLISIDLDRTEIR